MITNESTRELFKTSIHLNLVDSSSGQSLTESDELHFEDDTRLLQFNRVFKHLEDLENNLSELSKHRNNKKPPKEDEPTSSAQCDSMLNLDARALNEHNMNNHNNSHWNEKIAKPDESLNESPFFYSGASPHNKYQTNKSEGKKLKNEVNKLKGELEDLKSYNDRFYAKTSSLEQKIADINYNILNKKANNEFNPSYEDYNSIERNKVLSDLSHSKILLQKTSYISPISHASKYEQDSNDFFGKNNIQYTHPSVDHTFPKLKNIDFQNNNSNTDLFKNSVLVMPNSDYKPIEIRYEKEPKYNFDLSQTNLTDSRDIPINYDRNQLNLNFPNKLQVKVYDDTHCPKLNDDLFSIKRDLEKAHSENVLLKKKMLDTQKMVDNERNKSGLWKTMYDRVLHHLPASELDILRDSAEVEKLNLKVSENKGNEIGLLNHEQILDRKNTLQSAITALNAQNFSLKIKLERLHTSNQKGLEKLKYFFNENNMLKTELKLLNDKKMSESSEKVKQVFDLNTEIKNLNQKLKHEEEQRNELHQRYGLELNAAKIRYENELNKQNNLMQSKNENLACEVNRLNDMISRLQSEKIELMTKIQTEIALNQALTKRTTHPSQLSACNAMRRTEVISKLNRIETKLNSSTYSFDAAKRADSKVDPNPHNSDFIMLSPLKLDSI